MKKTITWEHAMQIFINSYWASTTENQKDDIFKLMEPEILRLARVYDELEATSE